MQDTYLNMYARKTEYGCNPDGTVRTREQWLKWVEEQKGPEKIKEEFEELVSLLTMAKVALAIADQKVNNARKEGKQVKRGIESFMDFGR